MRWREQFWSPAAWGSSLAVVVTGIQVSRATTTSAAARRWPCGSGSPWACNVRTLRVIFASQSLALKCTGYCHMDSQSSPDKSTSNGCYWAWNWPSALQLITVKFRWFDAVVFEQLSCENPVKSVKLYWTVICGDFHSRLVPMLQ